MLKSDPLLHIETHGESKYPTLVFIHGFLGSGEDWKEVIDKLKAQYYCVTLDLPGHGNSFNIGASCLAQSVTLIEKTLSAYGISDYVLIGYSMGARHIAYGAVKGMFRSMRAFVLEGANLGGLSRQETEKRLLNDTHWSRRFCTQALSEVLRDWYQQEVFASLDTRLRAMLIEKRCRINAQAGPINKVLGQMLLISSLAKQGDLRTEIQQLQMPKCYIVGEYDAKFRRLSAGYQIPIRCISHAGHNCHVENPEGFASALTTFIKTL